MRNAWLFFGAGLISYFLGTALRYWPNVYVAVGFILIYFIASALIKKHPLTLGLACLFFCPLLIEIGLLNFIEHRVTLTYGLAMYGGAISGFSLARLPIQFSGRLFLALCVSAIVYIGYPLAMENKISDSKINISELKLIDNLGQVYPPDAFNGKVVYLDLWFTGCASCIDGLKFAEDLKAQINDTNVVFIDVNVTKEKPEKIAAFMLKHHLSITTAIDSGNLLDRLNLHSVPQVLIFDKAGKCVLHQKGAETKSIITPQLNLLKTLLAE